MTLWQFIVAMAGQNLLPCLFASAIIYVFLSLLFGPGRLCRPADRTLFIYAGLFKAGLALWAGEGVSCLSADPRVFGYFALRLPNLAPNGPPFEPNALIAVLAVSQPVGAVLFAIALSATGMLCYRWARLAPLWRRIHTSRQVGPEEVPHVFAVFNTLVARADANSRRFRRPKLMVLRDAPSPAFMIGILHPIVALSADLVSQLADRELRGIMAHELAHVQRLDYIGRWLATILRDVMFWNPFVLHWYSRLIEEQEAASDECAAELLGDPVAVASGLVEVSAHAVRLPVVSVGPLRASQMARESDRLARRVDRLEESAILRHGRTQWPRALAYVVLVAFLMLQPHMALPLADLPALAGRAFRVSAAAAHWPI